MAKLKILAQEQIQRINQQEQKLKALQGLPKAQWLRRPAPGKWSPLEIIDHMNRAYQDYEHKVEQALAQLPDRATPQNEFYVGGLKKWFIEGQRPKGKKRSMKMKTFKRMDPMQAHGPFTEVDVQPVIDQYYAYQALMKKAIEATRLKEARHLKIDSAIGSLLRFYLPEAFEFLINHQERHWVQMEEVWE
jgi:hypothetical protein